MAAYRITCVTKDDKKGKGYQTITTVGGVGWKKTVAEVLSAMKAKDTFYVEVGADRVEVIGYPTANPTFIRTAPDGTKDDNLLSLKTCP
ncbi:DUF3892 domain-containing protein [Corallococcus carmarthensis]|uniref:DUF3892 domain-containing protein n=1 Tax=Corallococcus carmarthensis TaxID=2316728 RepID=A0A3A8JIM3_9BACT|nr:DUF3892 domain-containing protein [Corallococcus carmarthensis]RKG95622.1 DUF3892 domain-containing protein [Corallococcus carmarthensis]